MSKAQAKPERKTRIQSQNEEIILDAALEATWRVSTSQLYVLLKRLEQGGWLASSPESQSSRPAKRVFHLTGAGRKAFLAWLKAQGVI